LRAAQLPSSGAVSTTQLPSSGRRRQEIAKADRNFKLHALRQSAVKIDGAHQVPVDLRRSMQ